MRSIKGRLPNGAVEETITPWALRNCLSILARSSSGIVLSSSMMSENRWVYIPFMLIHELFALRVLMFKAVCTVLLPIPSSAHPVGAEIISSFILFSKVKPIFSAWITQLFPTPPSPLTYSSS